MPENSMIPGEFEKGERITFADFMDLPVGSVVWGKAKKFDAPIQIQITDGNSRTLTDGDKVGVCVEFPNVAPESEVAAFLPNVGQMEFFEAVPIFATKDD